VIDNRGAQRNVSCLFLSVHQTMKETLCDGNTVALYIGTESCLRKWMGLSEWRCSKLTSAPVTSEVVGSIPGHVHSSCDREGESLRQRRFPPGAPVSSYITSQIAQYHRVNNVLVDAQLSIQFFLKWMGVGYITSKFGDISEKIYSQLLKIKRIKCFFYT
jgi:hypothetical protein